MSNRERKTRVLVVDDDTRLRSLLDRYLTEQGFVVRTAANRRQMDEALDRDAVDLVVLDLMLPDDDGLEICRRLRAAGSAVPVVMLTAKGDDVDRIVGLELGADDYLPKPCNPRELVARIKAVLRRTERSSAGAPERDGETIAFGPFRLELATRRLLRGDAEVSLTTGEFAMLSVLAKNPHKPLSRDKLMTLARGREHTAYDRSVDVQISRLRHMLEADPAKPLFIQTVWGIGYVFVPDAEPRGDT